CLDLYKKRMLPDLLKRLSDIPGLYWIRLHYAYPNKFPLEVLDVMRERDNICNYLDMPLQHASDPVLKAMKRQITRAEMDELIGAIRERVPGICLRTTLITGLDRKSTRLNSSHVKISYAVSCLKKKMKAQRCLSRSDHMH